MHTAPRSIQLARMVGVCFHALVNGCFWVLVATMLLTRAKVAVRFNLGYIIAVAMKYVHLMPDSSLLEGESVFCDLLCVS